MAPLNPNLTDKVFIDYTTGDGAAAQTHTLMVRHMAGNANQDSVQGFVLGILNAYGAGEFNQGWRVLGVRVQNRNENFSLPAAINGNLAAFVGTRALQFYNRRHEAVEDVFVGRSVTTGRRARFSLYRAVGEADDTFRFGMSANLQNALGLAVAQNVFTAADGTNVGWKTYVNQNYNSYWEGELRS